MARSKDVLLRFLVDDKQKSKLAGIGSEAQKTQSKFQQLSTGTKAVVGGFAAIAATKIFGFLSEAATAAMEDEAAQKQLALALENTVGATEAQVAATEDFIQRTMMATGVADDELRPALAELVRTTGNLETAQETLSVAMDISAAKGIPLETVTKAIGKAALGNVGALGRLGVATKDATGATMDFDEVLQEANRTMGGATAAALETTEGKMRLLQVQFDELKEEIGGAFTKAVVRLGQDFGLVAEDWETAAASMRTEMDKNRHPIEVLTLSVEDQAIAFDELADSIREVADEQRAAADPSFALLKANKDLNSATRDYNTALAETGSESEATIDAALRLAEAQGKANAAAQVFADAGGAESVTALEDMLRAAGIAEVQIRAIIAAIQDLNRTPVTNPIRVGRGGDLINSVNGRRAAGGPVHSGGTYLVGEQGPELLTMGTSNGNVTPNDAIGGSYAITVNAGMGANGTQIGKLIVEEIRQYEKRNGRGWRS